MRRMEADILVIGSGIAGLTFALKAAEHGDVCVVTKKERAVSNTNYAQGGIAAVMANDDSPELHVRDTLVAGAGLCYLRPWNHSCVRAPPGSATSSTGASVSRRVSGASRSAGKAVIPGVALSTLAT
jgi:succinate dehydrogenase/fumarate reductase flavoprotein subunit